MNHKLPPIYRCSCTYYDKFDRSRYVQLVIRSLIITLSCKNLSDILDPIHKVALLFLRCWFGAFLAIEVSGPFKLSRVCGGRRIMIRVKQTPFLICTGKPRKRLMFSMWQWGFAAPRVPLLSSAHICYATNMSANQFFPDAQNFVIRGGTFMAADIVCDARVSHPSYPMLILHRSITTRAMATGGRPMQRFL